jgi:hypothetical protein
MRERASLAGGRLEVVSPRPDVDDSDRGGTLIRLGGVGDATRPQCDTVGSGAGWDLECGAAALLTRLARKGPATGLARR